MHLQLQPRGLGQAALGAWGYADDTEAVKHRGRQPSSGTPAQSCGLP